MKIQIFFQFVEIKTKLASMLPFALGSLYSLYRFELFNMANFLVMFVALLTFDMATTGINNYLDHKKSVHSVGIHGGIGERSALTVIFTLLAVAISFGLLLTRRTNIIILLAGIFSFTVGIIYTFGPVPISRTPLGELFSGLLMGFVIIFLAVYIHISELNFVSLQYYQDFLQVRINMTEVFYIFLFSLPAVTGIANIMLANNICDLEEDVRNNRFTLPFYLGKKNALRLLRILTYLGYVVLVPLVLLNIMPALVLFALLTLIPVYKNLRLFCARPTKKETFSLSVLNFTLLNASLIILLGTAILQGI